MPDGFDIPRILAINDVNLTGPVCANPSITRFYEDCIGLKPVASESEAHLRFRGYPRSGPQLIVELTDGLIEHFLRRQVLIQVGSLSDYADEMIDRGIGVTWSHGWHHFDRRLIVADPAGNLVELIGQHPL